jgi:hypothetical protein
LKLIFDADDLTTIMAFRFVILCAALPNSLAAALP